MKRVITMILLVLLLSGCHSQKFTYEQSHINLDHDLGKVLDLMLSKGNYSDSTRVEHDKVSLWIDYSERKTVIEAVQFQIFHREKKDENAYRITECFDEEGVLKCREDTRQYSNTPSTEELYLIDAFNIFSQVDIDGIVTEINTHYSIPARDNTIVGLRFKLPEDIDLEDSIFNDIVFYYDGEYHYDSSYIPSDIVLEIRVSIFGNGVGEQYAIYYEIDGVK